MSSIPFFLSTAVSFNNCPLFCTNASRENEKNTYKQSTSVTMPTINTISQAITRRTKETRVQKNGT